MIRLQASGASGPGSKSFAPTAWGAQHDGRAKHVEGGAGGPGSGLSPQQALKLGLFPRIEQSGCGAHRPVLGHADRVAGVKPVGSH